jgi:hypothetical protein
VSTDQLYDEEGHYLLAGRSQDDPAYPGQTPEPTELAVVFLGQDPVPCARSFLREAEPRDYDVIRRMLEALPGRRLTGVVGHGDSSMHWAACNEGHDGSGSWLIDRDPPWLFDALPPGARRTPPQPLDQTSEGGAD